MAVAENPLVVIPARGNSKRLPQKNKKLLGGKPLVCWTIESIVEAGIFNNIIVSSEDSDILDIAESMNVQTHHRPLEYSEDQVTVAELCCQLVKEFETEGLVYDAVYALLPTSPFRSAASIRRAWSSFIQSDADSLMSVAEMSHPPQWCFEIRGDRLAPLDAKGYDTIRQQLPSSYRPDGGHSIATSDALKKNISFLSDNTLAFVSAKNETLDIDTEEDWVWAEYLIEKNKIT